MLGTVKWFDDRKGYGFITRADTDEDYFVHYSNVEISGYVKLDEGQKVNFEIGEGKKGPCAVDVVPLV